MKRERNISAKRKAKEMKLWRNIFIVSILAVATSLLFFDCIAFLVSIVFALFAYGQYDLRKPNKEYGYTPWWYFGL